MNNIEITDKHIAFAYAIAAGVRAYKAYSQHLATKEVTGATARSRAAKLMSFPEIQQLIQKAKKERLEQIIIAQQNVIRETAEITIEQLPPELLTAALSVENLDAFHYSVVKGLVEVEEVVPIQKKTRNKNGRVVEETVSFMRVKRKANIKERQASADALYKRFGHYAPTRGMLGVGRLDGEEDGEGNVQRFITMSDGSKIPFE